LNGWIDLLFQNRQKPRSLCIFFSPCKPSALPTEIFSFIAFFFGNRLEFDAKILAFEKKNLIQMTVQADFPRKERLPDFLIPGDSFLPFVPIAHLSSVLLK